MPVVQQEDGPGPLNRPRAAAVYPDMRLSSLLRILTLLGLTAPLAAGDVRVGPDQQILLLATERTSTMQRELDEAVALGFRVISGAALGLDEVAYLLERDEPPGRPGSYLLLAARRPATLEAELNEAAARGYRLHPQSILFHDCELVLLMQPGAAEEPGYRYRVLETRRTSTLQRELEEAVGEGFRVVDLVSAEKNVAVLERQFSSEPE